MLLFPAIDLLDGQVVRLRQGRREEKTVYPRDPVSVAQEWERDGGDWLHIVDLNAAFTGEQRNLEVVRKIAASVSIPCELGGGMRSEAAVQSALDAGVSRVVIGTRAAESLAFIESVAAKYGSEKIAVGIDAHNGSVAVKGWTETTELRASDFALRAETAGAGTIIYTDIATDGMLTGPNFAEIEKLMTIVGCNVIASGGVSSVEDVRRLAKIENLYGAIIGKALYDGAFDLRDLREVAR